MRLSHLSLVLTLVPVPTSASEPSWTTTFALDPGDLASVGRNPYFVLEPGHTLVLGDGDERLTIRVLDETRSVDGVETRVVEEREEKAGQLVEVSRNCYAISRRTNSVFYFGEDVDMYEAGRVKDHKGAWMAGIAGARPGLMMPGLPLLGAKYFEEVAPGVAMDRAFIESLEAQVSTPAGDFKNVLKVRESTPLEPLVREHKYYVAGIGLVQDGALKLMTHTGPGR
jgi:hypothetical protein